MAARADEESPRLMAYRERVDQAIERGLAYLASQQVAANQGQQAEQVGSFLGWEAGNTGIAGLCVMAFLSKGCTPGNGPYGQLIDRGLDYLLGQQQETGLIVCRQRGGRAGMMYCHAIATLLLAEASGMVDSPRQKKIDVVLPKALALLLKAQQIKKPPDHAGGWRYAPTAVDSDLSLTGWAIMALRAGRLNGAPIPKANIEDAVQYILRCRDPAEGCFRYQPKSHPSLGLTGAAVLCLELCGEHGHAAIVPAGEYIINHMPARNEGSAQHYYAYYYCSQAAFQLGAQYWETWAPRMYDILLQSQQENGAWAVKGSGREGMGETYATSMSILAMTVSYRQLPIYHRDDSLDEPDAP